MIRLISQSFAIASIVLVAGCSHFAVQVDERAAEIEADGRLLEDLNNRGGTYIVHDEPYVAGELIVDDVISDNPLLDTIVAIRSAVPMSLGELVEYLGGQTHLTYHLSPDVFGDGVGMDQQVSQSPSFFVGSFRGTARELLSIATTQTGTHWAFEDDAVVIGRHQTKMWTLAGLPGSTTLEHEGATSGDSGGEGGGGGQQGGQGGGGAITTVTTSSSGNQGASVSSTTNYYEDLAAAIEALKSPAGKYQVSASTNTAIVTDTPVILKRVGRIIDQLNERTVRPIQIRFDIYSITRDRSEDRGADWDIVYEALSGRWAGGISTSGPVDADSNFASAQIIDDSYNYAGSAASLDFLSKQGYFVEKTTQSIDTLPGRPVDIHIGVDRSLITSTTQVLVPDAGVASSQQTSIVTDGFSLTGLANRLYDGSVTLMYQMTLSDVRAIEVFESGGFSSQQPTIAAKRLIESVRLLPGRTKLVDTYITESTERSQQGIGDPAFWALGGSDNSRHQHERLFIGLTLVE